MNFVTTLMRKNLHEFPKIVQLAADIGLDEAKAVFLTVFDDSMAGESLYGAMEEVRTVFAEAHSIGEKTGVKIKIPHIRGEDPTGAAAHKPCFTAWRDLFLGSDGYVRPCMSTPIKLFHIDEYATFDELWNASSFIRFRESVNSASDMPASCEHCYQSSYANWNRRSAFYQTGKLFLPGWGVGGDKGKGRGLDRRMIIHSRADAA
jgi:MoaA/NifB/PqqE/SkfB family radical SAM enzyme